MTNLEIFSEVYRLGSFSAVARRRGVSPSAISRAISGLEADLSVLLFYRTTRHIAPTEAASVLVAQVDRQIEAFQEIRSTLSDQGDAVTGTLRLSASHSFGIKCLAPILADFRAEHPDVTLEVSLTDRVVDIVGERFDLAIRHGPLPDSSLIATPILKTRYFVCASPKYLSSIAPIQSVRDVSKLDCLTFPLPGFSTVWRFATPQGEETEVPISGPLSANSGLILRECALRGRGVVMLSDWIIGNDIRTGHLIDLFPNMIATPTNYQTAISAVYPNRNYTPQKVKAFVSYLKKRLSNVGEAHHVE